jgi:hypothetical protein
VRALAPTARPVRTGRLLAALAVLLLAAAALAAAAPAAADAPVPAQAAVAAVPGADGGGLQVDLTGAEPFAPAPGGLFTITGSVQNVGTRASGPVAAVLRVSPTPLVSRSEVALVADQESERRGQSVPATRTELASTLAPGASVPFRFSTPAEDLPWAGNGVYAVFVQADSDLGTATASVPVPWIPAPQDLDPSRVAVVNPVLAPVDLSAANALLTDRLPRSMAPGGALAASAGSGAAALAAGVPVSWLADPAVLTTARGLAGGGATFSDSGGPSALAQVRQWVATVEAAFEAPGSTVYFTGYGQVDPAAVLRDDLPELLQQSLALSASAVQVQSPQVAGVITPLPPGTADPATTAALTQRGAGTVVLSESVAPPSQGLAYTPSGIGRWSLPTGELTAVVPDSGLQRYLAQPLRTPGERYRTAQALLADLAMVTLELPTAPRTVVLMTPVGVAPPQDWYTSVLTAVGGAPFIRAVGLPALLAADAPGAVPRTLVGAADAGALPASYLAPVPPLQQRLDAFSQVVTEPLRFAADFQAAILRSASGQWRDQQPLGRELLRAVAADLDAEEAKVTTISSGTVTLSGNSGILPLTVSNALEQDVEVKVVLAADPPVRLNFIPPELTLVAAGKRSVVEIPVEVFGTGPLPVAVTLTDRTGRPFLTTGDLELRATAANRIAAGFAAVSGAMLVAMVLWRFKKRGLTGEADASG